MSRADYRRAACRRSIVAALAGMRAAAAAQAQTITVNAATDDTADDHCTLREAISLAQNTGLTGSRSPKTREFPIRSRYCWYKAGQRSTCKI